MTAGVLLLVVAAGGGLALAKRSSSNAAEQAAVLRVAKAGRTAVLHDRPHAVCGLLTRRARRNSLLYANYVDERAEQKRPARKSCVRAVGFLIDEERIEYVTAGKAIPNPIFRRIKLKPSLASFRVIRIRGKRAHLQLTVPGGQPGYTDDADIYFLKGKAGWRADFASISPFNGSSGR